MDPRREQAVYRRLNERLILETLGRLGDRIEERFAGSGLSQVSRELLVAGEKAIVDMKWLRRPLVPVRAAAMTAAVLLVALLIGTIIAAFRATASIGEGMSDLLQGVDALVNDAVFTGIAVWFMVTLETRIKRKRALGAIHELRSIAHIVDMHQLTKDPERLLSRERDTASSPARNMSREQLGRYLDYCSELLSVVSKVAALYVQNFADPIVLETVSEVETLTTGLSGKIWQKITLLDQSRGEGPEERAAVPASG
jgi:flagellar biosynthesis protein FliQ